MCQLTDMRFCQATSRTKRNEVSIKIQSLSTVNQNSAPKSVSKVLTELSAVFV